jgi:D-glycero-alpha-D-manno-heptose-7-phosphate kinase
VPRSQHSPTVAVARAPARIDFGGGWTDVPPYCDREGGFVCNVAISRHARARVERNAAGSGLFVSPDEALLRAAAQRSRLTDVDITLTTDFPQGAGLGGSSAASAAVFGAMSSLKSVAWNRVDVAEEGRKLEVEALGIAGGRQDHYAATHGGALALTFTSSVSVRRIPLSKATVTALPSRSILLYTGESRISGETITAVLGAYQSGENRVVTGLAKMKTLAGEMARALEAGNLDDLGRLMAEHWEHQRSLHPSIPTQRIDEIAATARKAGALGSKAMGASGGGCVLVLAREGETERVRKAVAKLGTPLDFSLDMDGLIVEETA